MINEIVDQEQEYHLYLHTQGLNCNEAEAHIKKMTELLNKAEVPLDNRVMYYYKISWWRHPIKRYKQKQSFKKILETT